jgi:hypothetical protein
MALRRHPEKAGVINKTTNKMGGCPAGGLEKVMLNKVEGDLNPKYKHQGSS